MIQCRHPAQEAGMAHWYSDGLVIEKSRVRVPVGAVEDFLLQGQLSLLTVISVCLQSTPVLPQ